MSLLRDYATTPRLAARASVSAALVAVYLLGIMVPGPGVNTSALDSCSQALGGYFGLLNAVGAGGLSRLSPFSLGVIPFVTMALILMLAARALPPGRWLSATPRRRNWTVIIGGTLLLGGNAFAAAHHATSAIAATPGCDTPVLAATTQAVLIASAAMVAGSLVLLVLAQLVTRYGVGNGVSLLVAAGLMIGVPVELSRVGALNGPVAVVIAVAVMAALFIALSKANRTTRSLPFDVPDPGAVPGVQRTVMFTVPMNISGTIPIILANILVFAPAVIAAVAPQSGVGQWVRENFSSVTDPAFVIALVGLTVMFCFYQVIASYDARAAAQAMSDTAGAFARGTTTVDQSASAVDTFLLHVTAVDAAFLSVLAVLPALAAWLLGTSTALPLGGASLLILAIVVGAILTHARAVADYAKGRPLANGATHPDQLNPSLFASSAPSPAQGVPSPPAAPPSSLI